MQEPAGLRPDVLSSETPYTAAALWSALPETVEHVSTGASFTYRLDIGDRRLYLRLTPPGWQSMSNLQGEITFIEVVQSAGIAVASPVRSLRGRLIEQVVDHGNEFLAMAFEEAPGRSLPVRNWDEAITRRYGRLMAEAHAAAPQSLPVGQTRHTFEGEFTLLRSWLPETESEAHNFLEQAAAWSKSLPRTSDVFGLVHYDLCGDNILGLPVAPR